MPEGGFFERRTISPTGLTIVITLHAAAITALALSKMEMPGMKVFEPIVIEHIKPDPIPPEVPPEPVKDSKPVPRDTQIDYVPPIVPPSTPKGPVILHDHAMDPVVYDPGPPAKAIEPPTPPARVLPPVPPPAKPVRVEAQIKSGDLQPPYPRSEEQAGREGSVSLRVTIGIDGRVKAAQKISATTDGFYRATERHALRAWRFSPATVDGKPVESTKVLTVQFRIDE